MKTAFKQIPIDSEGRGRSGGDRPREAYCQDCSHKKSRNGNFIASPDAGAGRFGTHRQNKSTGELLEFAAPQR